MKLANVFFGVLLSSTTMLTTQAQPRAEPQTVYFSATDGTSELVGYLFAPVMKNTADTITQRYPAIVMLHGRGGPYSSRVHDSCTRVARGVSSACNAASLSKRHQMWGAYWAEHGYIALHLDSFGPRDRAHGYARYTHGQPERAAVNERTVRPLDAEAALRYLAQRGDVDPNRIMLQGWSNGGSTALNVMQRQVDLPANQPRFAAALAFYPGCGAQALLSQHLRFDAPVWVFMGTADEEVAPAICKKVLTQSSKQSQTGQIHVIWYDAATHDFDDPGRARQSLPANQAAKTDALQQAAKLLSTVVRAAQE